MKKYIICIITTLLLFSCFSMTALADNSAPTISDDYQTIYMDGKTYSRFNGGMIDTQDYDYDLTVELTDVQQEYIYSAEITVYNSASLLQAYINFKDGSSLFAYYLQADYINTYESMHTNPDCPYTIDFHYPSGNTITGTKPFFTANPVVLNQKILNKSNVYPVLIVIDENDARVHKGSLLVCDNRYYYVDYDEIKIYDYYEFSPYYYTELTAYEITDADLLADIIAGEEAYYDDDFGFLYNDGVTDIVSIVFLIFVFAALPAVAFILFLIFAIRSKGTYRKLFTTICCCSGVELILFTIIAIILY